MRGFFNKILFGGGHQEVLGWTFLPNPRDTEQLLARSLGHGPTVPTKPGGLRGI